MSLKSLNVKVKLEGKDIDLTYPILLDDSIKIIKNKLFLDEKYPQIPELVKLQVFNGKQNIIKNNDLIYEYYTNLLNDDFTPYISISNLYNDSILDDKIDILSDDDYKQKFNNLLNELIKDGYLDLDITDLEYVLMSKIHASTKNSNIYEEKISRYNNLKLKQRINLADKFPNDNLLTEFQNISKNNEIDLGDYKIIINDIRIKIIGNDVENGIKGSFIKLNEIFNLFELNEQIPFIALSKRTSNTKTPQIKVYNNILSLVSDKEIKSWVLNEKKKLNQATYKIIKGLLIKSRLQNSKTYISINILSNGEIYVNALFSKEDSYSNMNYNDIYNIIVKNIDETIIKLNTFQGVFLQSKRINSTANSDINVDSLDSSIQTDFEVNRNKLSNLLNSDFIREYILEKKDTESTEIFSAYYKKFKSSNYIDNDIDNDIKGITINIRDNIHLEKSSIINIYAASNLNQTIIILANIYILYILSLSTNKSGYFDIKTSERLIKKISQMKILKKEGVENLNSAKCQAPRHPDINHDNLKPLIDDSYILNYKDKDFRCPNTKYPYPGFTNSDIVCCFKNTQKGNVNYVRNIDKESLTIEVEPSNFKIKISTENNKDKSFETFIIRVISDYRTGLNENNSVSRYYYLEQDFKNDRPLLIPINNKELIEIINKEDNIWLNSVSLSKIIYPSSKTECSFKPNLNNTGSNFKINSPCDEHKDMPFFRYKNTSIPCCFDKEISPYLTAKSKKNNNTNQYILTSDTKILNPGKLAYLPIELINLFNGLSPNYKDLFYRQGVIKDDINSFLYAILLAIDNNIKSNKITNYIEFKNIIYKYLTKNIQEFDKLNNGDLLLKYSNINSYIKSFDTYVNWYETIELLEKIIKKNIIIIDIKEQVKDNIELRVLCRPKAFNLNKLDRPFIILLKRQKYFELLVRVTIPKPNNYIIDKKEFSADDNIIKFLLKYYKDSCIKKDDYPINYGEPIENNKIIPYIPLLKVNHIDEILNNIKDKQLGYIKYQIENAFHKINYLMTNKGIILPIFETGIISTIYNNQKLKVLSLSSLIKQSTKLLDLKTYEDVFKLFNTSKNSQNDIKIIGIANSNYNNIGGLLTNFGTFIPYEISADDKNFKNIEHLTYKYYIDIDNYLNDLNENIEFNLYSIYTNTQNDEIFNIKKKLGIIFNDNENLKRDIYNIIVDTHIDKGTKINNIYKIINPKITSDFEYTEILLKNIINDMLNDNIENLILNNIIVSDNFNKDDIVVRDSESVLLNINDIRNWIKVNKSEE